MGVVADTIHYGGYEVTGKVTDMIPYFCHEIALFVTLKNRELTSFAPAGAWTMVFGSRAAY